MTFDEAAQWVIAHDDADLKVTARDLLRVEAGARRRALEEAIAMFDAPDQVLPETVGDEWCRMSAIPGRIRALIDDDVAAYDAGRA